MLSKNKRVIRIVTRSAIRQFNSKHLSSDVLIKRALNPQSFSYVEQLAKFLKQNVTIHEPGRFVVVPKPFGVSCMGYAQEEGGIFQNSVHDEEKVEANTERIKQKEQKKSDSSRSITLEECLNELRRSFKEPNLTFCTGLKRYVSGPIVLPCNIKDFENLKKSVKTATASERDPFMHRVLAITVGRPPVEEGIINGFATFQDVGAHKEYVFKEAKASRRAKSGKFAVEGKMEYRVLAHNKGCSLVELGVQKFARHLPRLMLSALGAPILGDGIYWRRMLRIDEKPVMVAPKTLKTVKKREIWIPKDLENTLAIKREDVFSSVPMFIHVYSTVYPRFGSGSSEDVLVASAPPPPHFLAMVQLLGMGKDYEKFAKNQDDAEETKELSGETQAFALGCMNDGRARVFAGWVVHSAINNASAYEGGVFRSTCVGPFDSPVGHNSLMAFHTTLLQLFFVTVVSSLEITRYDIKNISATCCPQNVECCEQVINFKQPLKCLSNSNEEEHIKTYECIQTALYGVESLKTASIQDLPCCQVYKNDENDENNICLNTCASAIKSPSLRDKMARVKNCSIVNPLFSCFERCQVRRRAGRPTTDKLFTRFCDLKLLMKPKSLSALPLVSRVPFSFKMQSTHGDERQQLNAHGQTSNNGMSYQQPGYNPQYQNPYNQNAYGQNMAGAPPPPPGWNQNNQSQSFVPPPMPNMMHSSHDAETGDAGKYSFQFNDRSIRMAFIRKVFMLVFVMLAVVACMTAIPMLNPDAKLYLRRNIGLYWASYITFFVVYLVLMCCESVRRSFPINLIMTAVFTLAVGYMTMMITAQYNVQSVLLALIICTFCCGGIIIFASQSKYDLTKMMGIMFILSMCLMAFGLVAAISTIWLRIPFIHSIYALCAAVLFMGYLAIDIQMLMGGRKFEISPEDHIFAAIQIFIDIIYIFWMILSLLGSSNN
ncbi:unnamed protein product [Caenorhabditis auriculariae]|uniref:Uncharacterized protein n=1 Tax=Caenorhabditis auriculariae TaxID=2777116 RepID=A0A8S1HM09_9PELO|nr:unnamed protein product [Caenorhabditis auriculariae]